MQKSIKEPVLMCLTGSGSCKAAERFCTEILFDLIATTLKERA